MRTASDCRDFDDGMHKMSGKGAEIGPEFARQRTSDKRESLSAKMLQEDALFGASKQWIPNPIGMTERRIIFKFGSSCLCHFHYSLPLLIPSLTSFRHEKKRDCSPRKKKDCTLDKVNL